MPFQYRQFTATQHKGLKDFDQLDIYFYKPKSTGIGIKARFTAEGKLPLVFNVKQIQVKLIVNEDKLENKESLFEKWKKVKIPVQFTVRSFNHIWQVQKGLEMNQIQKLIKQHLKKICTDINKGISQCPQFKQYQKNQSLKGWIQSNDDLEEIYAVQKSRDKNSNRQEGFVSVIPLFKSFEQKDYPIYRTTAYEQSSQQKLKKLLDKHLVNTQNSENVSYPSFLEKKHCKKL